MANTSDIKNGSVIFHKNKRMKVIEFLHVKPGKGPAFVRTKLKDISSGKIIDETFNAGVKLEFLKIEAKEMQFLYNDSDSFIFMDNATYEQFNVPNENINDNNKDKNISVGFSDCTQPNMAINCPVISSTTTSLGSFALYNFK